ncbi:bacillithiol system redox-active protein YtxJ [Flavobacteriaceae bacterium LMO-SS05]
MGLLKKLFGVNNEIKEEKLLPWIPLNDKAQIETIKRNSKKKLQVIFKHSTRCGISKMVMNQFEGLFDLNADLDLYYLDILNHRDISNEIGYKFQVMHESPQLLVIKNEVLVAHDSHGAINTLDFSRFL